MDIGWANASIVPGFPSLRVRLAAISNVPVTPFPAGCVVASYSDARIPFSYLLGVRGTEGYVETWFPVFNLFARPFPFGIDVEPDR